MYSKNHCACITSAVFMEFPACLERKMVAKNHRILLLTDQYAIPLRGIPNM
jgi:hypothetical protein